ncbi:hypothetical protein [Stenotrophomonas maltophilia]|uniref:hypothetical protein n=1 Tax=Stenotrophomonas maltophilia TaxID=40324 RepID=UPI002893CC37|nr:hypothetical protein [Stenotrophomonas maltophilia]MDT3472334.1 hypothetical protein [Stenotrophomonas maltophilia]
MYNNTPHIPTWRLWLIHIVAKAVGVLVHVQGFPLGSRSKKYRLPSEPASAPKLDEAMIRTERRAAERYPPGIR